MTHNWSLLDETLAQYRASGQVLPIWWRDDDAVKSTPALDILHRMAEDLSTEVNIAVVPYYAQLDLAELAVNSPYLMPLVHGFKHENHAPTGQKKSEFGMLREGALADIAAGVDKMRMIFGAGFLPVFVPPWNRLASEYVASLPQAGLHGVSTFTPRTKRCPVPGLVQINTHIDPIDWKGTRDLKDPDRIIAETCAVLRARLSGDADADEPMGYLTHHLVHTKQVWDFTERFLKSLLDGGAHFQPIAPLLELNK